MLSDNRICEACKGGRYYNAFLKGCVKDSKTKSFLGMLEMYLHHKILHIYDIIDIFISPSEFLKNKLKEMGFRKDIICLPNFINTEEFTPNFGFNDEAITYFGRLSREKGMHTLVSAFKSLKNIKLNVIGDGPAKRDLENRVKNENIKNIKFLGHKTGAELKSEISRSMFVVVPSECYENNPMSVLESFALGKPVIGSNIGGIPELAKNGETGLLFNPGDADDLREKILSLAADKAKIEEMGRNARKFVEENFDPERHYESLMKIYKMAIEKHS
jgi:glycosyltransferase involved in cell wall biosynthesis